LLNLKVAMRRSASGRAQTKELDTVNHSIFCLRSITEKLIQAFQFIARGAVTERRILESPTGISITAETPAYR